MTEHDKDSVMDMIDEGFAKGGETDEKSKKHVGKFKAGDHFDEKHHKDDDESHLDVD